MFKNLYLDQSGFIVSAELVLIATLLVVGLVVGLSEIQHAVVSELNDVGDAIGALNQSFLYSGMSAKKGSGGYKSYARGSVFWDEQDDCDYNQCGIACDHPVYEGAKH